MTDAPSTTIYASLDVKGKINAEQATAQGQAVVLGSDNKIPQSLLPVVAMKAGTGISISDDTINHSNSVTAGSAGSSSSIPSISYDAQGHITSASSTTVYVPTTTGTSGQVWASDGTKGYWKSYSGILVYKGSFDTLANLISNVTSAEVGDTYNLNEAVGSVPAGTNWACKTSFSSPITSSEFTTYFDALGGTVDLSGYLPLTAGSSKKLTGALYVKSGSLAGETALANNVWSMYSDDTTKELSLSLDTTSGQAVIRNTNELKLDIGTSSSSDTVFDATSSAVTAGCTDIPLTLNSSSRPTVVVDTTSQSLAYYSEVPTTLSSDDTVGTDYVARGISLRHSGTLIGSAVTASKMYKATGSSEDGSMTQKAITDALGTKQATLTAGTGIDITDNVISCTSTGSVTDVKVDGTSVVTDTVANIDLTGYLPLTAGSTKKLTGPLFVSGSSSQIEIDGYELKFEDTNGTLNGEILGDSSMLRLDGTSSIVAYVESTKNVASIGGTTFQIGNQGMKCTIISSSRPALSVNSIGQQMAYLSDLSSYLPLSAGSSKSLTDDLYLATGKGVLVDDTKYAGAGITYDDTKVLGITASSITIGNASTSLSLYSSARPTLTIGSDSQTMAYLSDITTHTSDISTAHGISYTTVSITEVD